MKEFFVRLIGLILPLISPVLKELLHELIQGLYEKAKGTDNVWDDIFVELLMFLLGVPKKGE